MDGRVIPAGAGNTKPIGASVMGQAGHPRGGGEHSFCRALIYHDNIDFKEPTGVSEQRQGARPAKRPLEKS